MAAQPTLMWIPIVKQHLVIRHMACAMNAWNTRWVPTIHSMYTIESLPPRRVQMICGDLVTMCTVCGRVPSKRLYNHMVVIQIRNVYELLATKLGKGWVQTIYLPMDAANKTYWTLLPMVLSKGIYFAK
jgi:hypothetical protein